MTNSFLTLEATDYMIYAGIGALGLLIQALVIRWAVRADESVKNQRAIILLLQRLCDKDGISLGESSPIVSDIIDKKEEKSFASIFGTRIRREDEGDEELIKPPKYD